MSEWWKCCVRCGRWGTQLFRLADHSDGYGEGWICDNDRACRIRQEGGNRGTDA